MNELNMPLRRSRTDRKVAGVIGGLAEYIGIDPTLARVIYVVGSLVSAAFPGLLVYIILWAIVPDEYLPASWLVDGDARRLSPDNWRRAQ